MDMVERVGAVGSLPVFLKIESAILILLPWVCKVSAFSSQNTEGAKGTPPVFFRERRCSIAMRGRSSLRNLVILLSVQLFLPRHRTGCGMFPASSFHELFIIQDML